MSDAAGIVVLIGRIVFTIPFLFAATGHIGQGRQMVEYARAVRFPVPALASWPAGLWLLVGGLSVLLGVWPDIGALILGLWVIPTAWWFHAFWKIDDPQQKQTQQILFLRNLTFLGANIILFGVFVALGEDLRYTVTRALFSF